jgi:hypothetical protein
MQGPAASPLLELVERTELQRAADAGLDADGGEPLV